MFKVTPGLSAKTSFEIPGWEPQQSTRKRIKSVVHSASRDAECAHIIAEHRLILQAISYVSGRPYTRRVRRSEKLIRNVPAINVCPKWEITLDTSSSG